MQIDITKLPPWAKIEIIKEALLAFADKIQKSQQSLNQFPIPEDELLDVTEAALYLKLAKQTIYQLTSKKAIPFIKKGKKNLFLKSELRTWLNEDRQTTKII